MRGFRLAAVLRARQAREDAAKTAVADARAVAENAATKSRDYQRDLDGRAAPDEASGWAYSASLQARHALAGTLSDALNAASIAEGTVRERVDDLAGAAAARRAMEHLAERHAAARSRAEDAAEQAAMDDLAIVMIADVLGRIQQIRGQIGLSVPTGTTMADSTTAGSATTAGSFASTLASLTGGTGSVTGSDVVTDAQRYLGIPYVFGGTNPATGLDCSGLVQRVYKDLGITLPRTAAQQATMGQPVASLAQAQPGDLLAFDSPVDHIGIYVGNGNMLVAPKTGDHVKIQQVYKTPSAIRRIVDTSSTAGVAPLSVTASGVTTTTVRPATLRTATTQATGVPGRSTACRRACSPPLPRSSPATTRAP
jgi:flagellar export protein FliJ